MLNINKALIERIYNIGSLETKNLAKNKLDFQFLRKMIKYHEESGELAKSVIQNDDENFLEEFADQFVVLFDLANRKNIDETKFNEMFSKKIDKWERYINRKLQTPNFVLTQVEKAIYEAKLEGKVEIKFVFQINFDRENIQDSIDFLLNQGYELCIKMRGEEYKEILISWEI